MGLEKFIGVCGMVFYGVFTIIALLTKEYFIAEPCAIIFCIFFVFFIFISFIGNNVKKTTVKVGDIFAFKSEEGGMYQIVSVPTDRHSQVPVYVFSSDAGSSGVIFDGFSTELFLNEDYFYYLGNINDGKRE